MNAPELTEAIAELQTRLLARAACAEQSRWLCDSVRVPLAFGPELFDNSSAQVAVFFDAREGTGQHKMLGWDVAIHVRGEDDANARFSAVGAQIEQQLATIDVPDSLAPYLRFYGGGAFDPRQGLDEVCWREFGACSFFLPAISLIQREDACELLVVVQPARILELCERVQQLLVDAAAASTDPALDGAVDSGRGGHTVKTSADAQEWKTVLDDAQSAFDSGVLHKVVAARRVTVELEQKPQLSAVLRRLAQSVDSTVFALRIGDRCFLGATPETLVHKSGSRLVTEALAGTAPLDPQAPERATAALLNSDKDRREHDIVVRAIAERLGPLCSSLDVPEQPQIKTLRRMHHLQTPIEGTLLESVHVLDLVQRLHPTPAVGGLPLEPALAFIRAHEQAPRGWYAAPFGWVDSSGNGRFVVALRSALIAGNKCHVYAGAGIVRSSDPVQEFAETELKMSAMLGALGLAC